MEKETNETEKPSEAEKAFKLICEDYEKAMVHILILHTKDDEMHLLFAQVECLPEEFRDVPEISYDHSGKNSKMNKTCIYKNIKGDKTCKRLYYHRFLMKTKEALYWYHQCIINKTVAIPHKNDLPRDIEVKCCGPFVEPALWPQFVTSRDLPFMSAHWQTVRSHHYMPCPIDTAFEDFFANMDRPCEAVDWCEKALHWPIGSYKEYWGSLNLVLPNPLYRKNEMYFASSTDAEAEQMFYRFVPRISSDPVRSAKLKEDFNNLMMYQVERHAGSFFGFVAQPVQEDVKFEHSKIIDSVTNMVVCPKRGILDYSPLTSFFECVIMNMARSTEREITFQNGGSELTCTNQYSYPVGSSKRIGAIEKPFSTWNRQYVSIKVEREAKAAAKRKELWLDDKQEAKRTIEGIIKTARQRLIIVDPYFATAEIFNFLTKISFSTVQPTILTSNLPFKTKESADDDAYFSSLKKRDDFNTALEDFAKHWPKASVRVMLGGHIIHDRFLMVDDTVWLSGNSLNNIGGRASMLVKLDNPEAIINKIELACSDVNSKPWHESYEEYKSNATSAKVSSGHDR